MQNLSRRAFCVPMLMLLVVTSGCDQRPAQRQAARVEQPDAAAPSLRQATNASTDAAAQPPERLAAFQSDDPSAAWPVDAVFYQIFPERFRNGDPTNDPTRESLEFPENVSDKWKVTPWTGDWYARAQWETERGDSFYEHGVFDRRYGGDLQGVIDKLDYLEELGVNTLYFNPVFFGRSLHKYDGASMHHIDPYFGPDPSGDLQLMAAETSELESWQWTAADRLFLNLVGQLHERGMRIVIDGVFNHTGRDFFAFAHLREHQQESPYQSWYIVQQFDDPQTPQNEFRYKGWWGVDTLPEFANQDAETDLHRGPKQYVMDITSRWMDPNGDGDPADGIDGWRLDVANEVPIDFWKAWNAHVRRINPAAYTVAEIWDDAQRFLSDGGFSATMNYHGFAFVVNGFLIDGKLTARDFSRELLQRTARFETTMRFSMQNLIDSHDTPRLASMIINRKYAPYVQPERFDYDVGERSSPRWWDQYPVEGPDAMDRKIQRLVALMQMTYIGAPMIYYGTEAGMWGADDPCDRMPMVWDDLQFARQEADPLGRPRKPDEVQFDQPLFDFYQAAIRLRHKHPALRRGSCRVLGADDDAQAFVFQRELDGDSLVVALNRGMRPFDFTLPKGSWEVDIATGHGVRVDRSEQPARAQLPELEGAVFVRRQ